MDLGGNYRVFEVLTVTPIFDILEQRNFICFMDDSPSSIINLIYSFYSAYDEIKMTKCTEYQHDLYIGVS